VKLCERGGRRAKGSGRVRTVVARLTIGASVWQILGFMAEVLEYLREEEEDEFYQREKGRKRETERKRKKERENDE
jgi:hypothetical protein